MKKHLRGLGRRGFREQGADGKHLRGLGRKVIFLSGSREQRPPSWGGGGAHLKLRTLYLREKADIYDFSSFVHL